MYIHIYIHDYDRRCGLHCGDGNKPARGWTARELGHTGAASSLPGNCPRSELKAGSHGKSFPIVQIYYPPPLTPSNKAPSEIP